MRNENFIWDDEKNEINTKKHGISFEEAKTVFLDNDAMFLRDDEHSFGEERFKIIGISAKLNLLVVCHCYRENDTIIRLISARKADKKENDLYNMR